MKQGKNKRNNTQNLKEYIQQLAQTGIGISLACAAILLLAGLAYAMKTFVQYKRETSED